MPEVRTPLTLEAYLDDPPAALRLMLVEPATSATSEDVESLAALHGRPAPADAVVMIGPEGGWTAEERAATHVLRRALDGRDAQQGIEMLLDGLRKTPANAEFLTQLSRSNPGRE